MHLVVARASGKMTTPQAADAAVSVLHQVCLTILNIYPNHDLILLVTRKIDGKLTVNIAIKINMYSGVACIESICFSDLFTII